jgi:hypothetical protein
LDDTKVLFFANQQISAHVESLAHLLTGSDSTHVFVVPPLLRIVPGEHIKLKDRLEQGNCLSFNLLLFSLIYTNTPLS